MPLVVHVVISVEHDGNDFFLEQTQVNAVVVAVVTDKPRVHHIGLVDVLVIVVVLHASESFCNRRSWDERRSDPVMNQPTGHASGKLVRPGLCQDLSFANATRSVSLVV